MKIAKSCLEIQALIKGCKYRQKIALVPTMGNLHAGHGELISEAKKKADVVVVSIFVNPLQFGPKEDFGQYPRTLEADVEKLSALKVDVAFTPTTREIYPNLVNHTQVKVPHLSQRYCGDFRPLLFDGVTTVVTKLFNLIQPDMAFLGEKDYQQLLIIKKMVDDLRFPLKVIGVPTVREPDGLAMSSRNQYLTAEERASANALYQTLCRMKEKLLKNEGDDQVIKNALCQLQQNSFKVDYLSICHQETLDIATPADTALVILTAAWLGKTRLIDNILLNRPVR